MRVHRGVQLPRFVLFSSSCTERRGRVAVPLLTRVRFTHTLPLTGRPYLRHSLEDTDCCPRLEGAFFTSVLINRVVLFFLAFRTCAHKVMLPARRYPLGQKCSARGVGAVIGVIIEGNTWNVSADS